MFGPVEPPESRLEEIVRKRRELDALEAEWLELVSEYDRCGDWHDDGYFNAACALRSECRITSGAAHTHVRAARRLSQLPKVAGAYAAGDIGREHVSVITRAFTNAREEAFRLEPTFVEAARRMDPKELLGVDDYVCGAIDGDGGDARDYDSFLARALLHWAMSVFEDDSGGMRRSHVRPGPVVPSSAFVGFRFPPEVIVLAVRWYLRFGLSYRDVEELLAERGIEVDHVTVFRWVQRFTPLLVDAARPCRHIVGDRWCVDETYVKVAGRWRYVYRAIDQYGQIIDVYVSPRRDTQAARRFFTTALRDHGEPAEVVTDRAWTLLAEVDELMPGAFHNTDQYANNRIEADHGRLKSRLRPMRGLKCDRTARVIMHGDVFMQNLRRGHYELAVDACPGRRVAIAFTELAQVI